MYPETQTLFRISPLVRYTLYGLLLALVLPLPFLLVHQGATQWLPVTLLGVSLGWGVLVGLMSQRVAVDGSGVRVEYALWVPGRLVRGWQLPWEDLAHIQTRATGQGGQVHYLVNYRGDRFLLPMRIAGFARLLRLIEERTGLDLTPIKPLAQPWMYLTLLFFVVMLLLVDVWVIAVAASGHP
ncbi:hypothetical protein [Anthocerotibacter panamensis]|uniref:hypothetical protein n=1 Tax=Anthocerotibacter panamensis TaxID=2857077 RepID=UPI001C4034AA|nr:hypothetical protein [Anthocerotibacter panamensis]